MLSTARDEIAPLFGRADEQRILASALDEIPTRGQALVLRFLSHRTISTHLYRVFPKLGITSRAELTTALAPGAAAR